MSTIYQGPQTIVGNYNPAFNIPMSTDLNALRPIEVSQLFGQAISSGDRVINSLKAPRMVGDIVKADTVRVGTQVITPTVASPSGQPLVIHSSTGVVNFGGATIINTQIVTDPNVYSVVDAITTVNTMPTVGATIPIGAYAYSLDATITCVSGSDYGSVRLLGYAKGLPASGTPFLNRKRISTAGLNGFDAYFAPAGSSVDVIVVGIAGVVNWRINVDVVRVA